MGNSHLHLRFPRGHIPGSFKDITLRWLKGSLYCEPLSSRHWGCCCDHVGQCWLLPKRARGYLFNWKHTLQLQTFPQMVLVLWFSMWVIQLITTSFLSQTFPGKLWSLLIWGWILGSAAKAAGLRLLINEVETTEACCSLLSCRGAGGLMLRNQTLASEGGLSHRQFWNDCRRILCYFLLKMGICDCSAWKNPFVHHTCQGLSPPHPLHTIFII